MVEVAWRAVPHHPRWRRRFHDLARRRGERQASVAIARKLLVVVWHVLTHRPSDRQAADVGVARKRFAWAMALHKARTEPLAVFTRRQLSRLGLGAELVSFVRCANGKEIRLPPLEEAAVLEASVLSGIELPRRGIDGSTRVGQVCLTRSRRNYSKPVIATRIPIT
jgi:hypothetical protein